MSKRTGTLSEGKIRSCKNGHTFRKTGDCLVCPRCEELEEPTGGLLSLVSAPARRALQSLGVKSSEDLANYSEKELLSLHGFGPSSLPALRNALKKDGLKFRHINHGK